jgi:hypothetical protein
MELGFRQLLFFCRRFNHQYNLRSVGQGKQLLWVKNVEISPFMFLLVVEYFLK